MVAPHVAATSVGLGMKQRQGEHFPSIRLGRNHTRYNPYISLSSMHSTIVIAAGTASYKQKAHRGPKLWSCVDPETKLPEQSTNLRPRSVPRVHCRPGHGTLTRLTAVCLTALTDDTARWDLTLVIVHLSLGRNAWITSSSPTRHDSSAAIHGAMVHGCRACRPQ